MYNELHKIVLSVPFEYYPPKIILSITKEMHGAIMSSKTFMHSMIVPVTSYFIIPRSAVILKAKRPFTHSTF